MSKQRRCGMATDDPVLASSGQLSRWYVNLCISVTVDGENVATQHGENERRAHDCMAFAEVLGWGCCHYRLSRLRSSFY